MVNDENLDRRRAILGQVSVDVRLVEPGEEDAWVRSVSIPFLEQATPDSYEHWRTHLEATRTWVAVDGDRFVGNSCVFTRDVTLPGLAGTPTPTVPMAAISGVGVHPTHRRRGILRRLMGVMLADARRRGEPLAGLQATEAGIYGRFGFGCATTVTEVTVPSQGTRFAIPAPEIDLRLCDAAQASKVLPGLFDRLRRTRPGQVSRDDAFWTDYWVDQPRSARAPPLASTRWARVGLPSGGSLRGGRPLGRPGCSWTTWGVPIPMSKRDCGGSCSTWTLSARSSPPGPSTNRCGGAWPTRADSASPRSVISFGCRCSMSRPPLPPGATVVPTVWC